ncbi:MAG: hypothetical protein H6Q48_3208 [Deltaproteobacteria bacterium]|nr:hypothetical protein [Deltaproteobacteria bacterium]
MIHHGEIESAEDSSPADREIPIGRSEALQNVFSLTSVPLW